MKLKVQEGYLQNCSYHRNVTKNYMLSYVRVTHGSLYNVRFTFVRRTI